MPNNGLDMDTTSDIKTFRGRNLDEVLPQVRAELGPDAIVIRRREGLAGGVAGFFQRSFVEVEARPSLPDEQPLGLRTDRATIEGLATPGVQVLVQQGSPFSDALATAADGVLQAAARNGDAPAVAAGLYGPQPAYTPALLRGAAAAAADALLEADPPELPVQPVVPELLEPELVEPALAKPAKAEPVMAGPEPEAQFSPQPAAVSPPEPAPQPAAELPPEPRRSPRPPEPEPAPAPVAQPEAELAPAPITAPEAKLAPAPEPEAELAPAPVAVLDLLPQPAPAPVMPPEPAAEVLPEPEPTPEPVVAVPALAPMAPAAATPLEDRLVTAGLSPSLAAAIVGEAVAHGLPFSPSADLTTLVRTTLARRLHVLSHVGQGTRRIAFVGAGGAGKSAAITALARAYAEADAEVVVVALRSADGGRELAEKLEPQGVSVIAAADVDQAQRRLASRNPLICLVDTPSAGPGEQAGVTALDLDLQALNVDEVHLTLPATLSAAAADELAATLSPLGITHVALTHADQTSRPGAPLELAMATWTPLSYVCGRDSIAPADATDLAERLLP